MITKVTVLTEEFKVVKTFEKSSDLNEFRETWDLKQKLQSQLAEEPHWNYKLDIIVGGRSERWLYSSIGQVKILSKSKNIPIYKIMAVDEFNTMLGIIPNH